MIPIRLSRATWLFLLVVVVIVVPTLAFLAILPSEIDRWLIKNWELPDLEKTLGFKTGYVAAPPGSGLKSPVFGITSVTPEGVFWRAGIRPGDIPVG